MTFSYDKSRIIPAQSYRQVVFPKTSLVLHFTAGGTALGALDHWTKAKTPVSTAWVVDRDGTIFQAFEDHYWSFHLGLKGKMYDEGRQDSRAVGVELANWGPLKVGKDGHLKSWPNNWTNRYCNIEETDKYIKLDKPWRGIQYFATFPEAQMISLAKLVGDVLGRYEIPFNLVPKERRLDLLKPEEILDFKGILTHSNYREDKWDIGPAFDWDYLRLET